MFAFQQQQQELTRIEKIEDDYRRKYIDHHNKLPSRKQELKAVYRVLFDVGFKNDTHSKQGYPLPKLDGEAYYAQRWLGATITEEELEEVKLRFDKEVAKLPAKTMGLSLIRESIMERLWVEVEGRAFMARKREVAARKSKDEDEARKERCAERRADEKKRSWLWDTPKKKLARNLRPFSPSLVEEVGEEDGEEAEVEDGEVQEGGPGAPKAKRLRKVSFAE